MPFIANYSIILNVLISAEVKSRSTPLFPGTVMVGCKHELIKQHLAIIRSMY